MGLTRARHCCSGAVPFRERERLLTQFLTRRHGAYAKAPARVWAPAFAGAQEGRRTTKNSFPIWISPASRSPMSDSNDTPAAPSSNPDAGEEGVHDPIIAALLNFEPAPRQNKRKNGWTPALQRMFIAEL